MNIIGFALVLAALNELTTARVKKYFHINVAVNWQEAEEYCQDNYTDLSSINSEMEKVIFQADIGIKSDGWIGLNNNGRGWQWSDNSIKRFEMWTNGEPIFNDTKNQCVKLKDGKWELHDCNKKKEFFCYKWIPGVTLVPRQMSWENALTFCRTHYSDLGSLTTPHSLLDAKSKTNTSVWTGLRFLAGSWFWVTGEPLGNVTSLPSCPAQPNRCAVRNPETDLWESKDCEEKLNFLCNEKEWTDNEPDGASGSDTDQWINSLEMSANQTVYKTVVHEDVLANGGR